MTDTFKEFKTSLESPAEHHFLVQPSDTTDLPYRPRALRIGTAGTVVVRDVAGNDVSYSVEAGEILSIRAVRVLAGGTTATSIVGWY